MSKEYYYTKNKDGFMGSENRKVRKKKPETCEEQLRYQCKLIAEDITAGEEDAHKWCEGVYDIEWITNQDHSYKAARLMVAGGGPNIWVNLQTNTVDGYWWGDHCTHRFEDNLGLDEYLEELHASSK
jgi:hypothetical protein